MYQVKDIVVGTIREAAEVVEALEGQIKANGAATVADFYQLCGVRGGYGDDLFGWTKFPQAVIQCTGDGWTFKFPEAERLNRNRNTHDAYHHADGTVCIWVANGWFVPLDAGGEGYDCTKTHHA